MSGSKRTGLGLHAAGLENLESRLLLTHVDAGAPFTFVDLNNRTLQITMVGGGFADVFGPGPVDLADGMDIDSIHLQSTDSTTTLTVIDITSGEPAPLGTVAGFWSYGADGVPGGNDDIAAPDGTGPVRVTGDITSDGPVNRIVIDGLILGWSTLPGTATVELGGDIQAFYCGYLDGDVNTVGTLNYLEVAVDAGLGDPSANAPIGGLIKAYQIGEARIDGTLYKNIDVGEGLVPADYLTPSTYTELEKIGLTELFGRLPNVDGAAPLVAPAVDGNGTLATAERITGVGNAMIIDGNIVGRLTPNVPPQGTYDDFVDFYAIDLLPGQTINVTLDSGNSFYAVLVKPDGTFLEVGDDLNDLTYTATNSGEYYLAVVNMLSFSLTGNLIGPTGPYELTIDGLTPISLGSLTADNVGTSDFSVTVLAQQGDIANVTGMTAINLSTINAMNGNVLDTNAPAYSGAAILALGNIGLVEGGTMEGCTVTAQLDLMAVRLTGDLGTPAGGGNSISANQNIGQVIVAGNIVMTAFVANADNLGDPGFINLIDVTGDFGVLGGNNSITVGAGGDMRFLHVGGTVYSREGLWSTVRDPISFDFLSPASHLTIVDDSGGILRLTPSVNATGSYITFPINDPPDTPGGPSMPGVGVAIVNLTISGNVGISTSGDVQFGTVDWTPAVMANFIRATDLVFGGSGKADIYELNQSGIATSIVNNTGGSIISANLGTVGLYSVKSGIGMPSFATGAPELVHGFIPNPADPGTGGIIDGVLASGDLTTVRSNGSIHDVVCLGNLGNVVPDADNYTPAGQFDGIVGVIYGGTIAHVDVGDGMIQLPSSQFAEVGIYSPGKISLVTASGSGVRILAPILSPDSIDKVLASNGASLENVIGCGQLGEYINGSEWLGVGLLINQGSTIGQISVSGHGSIISGALIYASQINKIISTGGTDGMENTIITGNQKIGTISIDGPGIYASDINCSLDMGSLQLTGPNGAFDSSGLYVANVLGKFDAYNVLSSTITVELKAKNISIRHDLQASTLSGGSVGAISIGGNMEDLLGIPTVLTYAGPIKSVTIKGTARGTINATGPNAKVGSLKSYGPMDMIVRVEGSIGGIYTAAGQGMDLDLEVDGPHASLGTIYSGDYLHGRLVINGPAKQIKSDGEMTTDGQLIYVDGDLGKIISTGKGGGPTNIGANIVINGRLKQLVSAGGVSGIVQASRGIDSFQADGNVSASILSNTYIKNVAIAGNFSGDLTAVLDVNNVTIGGAITGQLTSQQGSIKQVASVGDFGGSATAWLDLVKLTSGAVVSGDFTAGRDILSVTGDSFTGTVVAARNIGSLSFVGDFAGQAKAGIDLQNASAGSFTGGTLAALRNIGTVTATGSAVDSFILAGFDTGADLVVGGGDDVATGGNLSSLSVGGDLNNSVVAAGVDQGADGWFGTDDDAVAPGESRIGNVNVAGSAVDGAMDSYGVFADTAIGSLSIGGSSQSIPASSGKFGAKTVEGIVVVPSGTFAFSAGSPVVLTDTDGDIVTVSLTGPGSGTLSTDTDDLAAGKITSLQLAGTDSSASTLIVVVTPGPGGDGIFHADLIEAGDDAGLKGLLAPALAINGSVGQGILLDGNIGSLEIDSLADGANADFGGNVASLTIFNVGATNISVGGALAKVATGPWAGGMLTTRELGRMLVSGNMNADIQVTASALKTGITVTGALNGDITSLMDLDSLAIGGTVDDDVIRAVGSINKLTLGGTVSNSAISAGRDIGTVKAVEVVGSTFAARNNIGKFTAANLTDSGVLAGYFLGADGEYGTGDDALVNGSIKSVTLSGNLDSSVLAAGVGEGSDGFYGTVDDTSREGYSSIDKVKIAGTVDPVVGNAIVAGSHLGKVMNGKINLATLGWLAVGARPNAAGAPRISLAEQIGPRVVITFTEDILPETVTTLSVIIVGDNTGPQTPSDLYWDPTTHKVTWDQGLMFVSDTYTVTVSGTGANFITDRGGRALDGILVNGTYPTGSGIDGSDLVFTFTV